MIDRNITMVRGDTLAFGVQLDGLTQQLDSAFFSCKIDPEEIEYVFQKSLRNGIELVEIGEDAIYYRFRVAPEDTYDLNEGKYYYDAQIGVNGDIFTILKGVLVIQDDITREE